MTPALLVLADGTAFEGSAFGAEGETIGEVVFNTALSGYQEILTDPSYRGQIVTMTNPLIGNYGVSPEDAESRRPFVEGFIVKEASPVASNWRSAMPLPAYLQEHGIVGIQGIDTRALTRHLRDAGAQQGVISTVDLDPASLAAKAQAAPGLIGRDLVKEVSCREPFDWAQGVWRWPDGYARDSRSGARRYKVVAYDCGIKWNILRQLVDAGCDVTVVPASTGAEEVLARNPDGLFLSNGPGDPEGVPYLIAAVRQLLGRLPIFGICLGHQILGLALGGRTYKLKFGHHGGNHPVQELGTGRIEITVQNHGFAVDMDSFRGQPSGEEIVLTHLNLNDRTCEGLAHRRFPLFAVQYHPEASPGPHDANHLFRRFVDLMEGERTGAYPPAP